MGSITRDRLQRHSDEEAEEEEVVEAMENSAAMEALYRFNVARQRKYTEEWMTFLAERGEMAKKHGYNPTPPPIGILNHPEVVNYYQSTTSDAI